MVIRSIEISLIFNRFPPFFRYWYQYPTSERVSDLKNVYIRRLTVKYSISCCVPNSCSTGTGLAWNVSLSVRFFFVFFCENTLVVAIKQP